LKSLVQVRPSGQAGSKDFRKLSYMIRFFQVDLLFNPVLNL